MPVGGSAVRRVGAEAGGAVPGGPGGAGARLRGGADRARGSAAAPRAPVGGLLAGARAVGAPGAGPVLATAAAAEPAGHALAGYPEDAGVLPADRSGQRVEAALVRAQRHGGSAGPARGGGGWPHAVSVLGQAGCAQARVLLFSAGAMGDAVRRALRCLALRPDVHLFRERPAVFGQAPVRLQPGQALGLRAGGDRPGGDAGGLSAGLRGDAGQHQRQDHAGGLPGEDRGAVRAVGAGVDHGPGAFRPRRRSRPCAREIRPCAIWSARPRAD